MKIEQHESFLLLKQNSASEVYSATKQPVLMSHIQKYSCLLLTFCCV